MGIILFALLFPALFLFLAHLFVAWSVFSILWRGISCLTNWLRERIF